MKAHLTLKSYLSNIKLLPLLAGAVSLSLSAATITPAFAQSTTPTPSTEQPQWHRQNKLNLTAEQQQKMQQIRQASRQQIDAILTADQKAQLQAAKPQQGKYRRGFASLNLTPDQKSKIQAVMQSSKQQMDAILTPEQRQQLQQFEQKHQQRHRQPGSQGSQAPN